MKQFVAQFLTVATCCFSIVLHAATPNSAEKAAGQAAATSWLAILDTGDYGKAASGLADETLATIKWPTKEERAAAAVMFLDPNKRRGDFSTKPAVTRKLQPDGVKQVTTCNCGIRDGVFFTFTYDVNYKWDDRRFHVQRFRNGTDVVFMLLEPDGSWRPAAIASQYGRHGF
jgi:hypothetical protein